MTVVIRGEGEARAANADGKGGSSTGELGGDFVSCAGDLAASDRSGAGDDADSRAGDPAFAIAGEEWALDGAGGVSGSETLMETIGLGNAGDATEHGGFIDAGELIKGEVEMDTLEVFTAAEAAWEVRGWELG